MDCMHASSVALSALPRRSRRIRRAVALAVSLVIAALLILVVTGAIQATAGGPPALGAVSADESAPGEADGVVERGDLSIFDDVPAVTGIRPELLAALRAAAADAEADGVRFVVNSGWRSARLQEQLLDEAVARYGSREEAARWVATPETSAHVTGDAVDLGPWAARDWLAQRGARYGLCQIYANEPWHYELRTEAPTQGCPATYADPTQDPRLR